MKCKKIFTLTGIVICFLMSIIFTSKAKAVDYSVNLKPVKTISSGGFSVQYRVDNGSSMQTSNDGLVLQRLNNGLNNYETVYIYGFYTNLNIDVVKGHYYEIQLFTRLTETANVLGTFTNIPPSISDRFSLVSIKRQTDQEQPVVIWSAPSTGSSQPYNLKYFYPNQTINWTILIKAEQTGSFPINIGRYPTVWYTLPEVDVAGAYTFIFSPTYFIQEYEMTDAAAELQEQNEKDDQDRTNLEDQQADTESEANEEGESAEDTGTTLFTAFTQFFNALTNVNGTSCVLPNMQVYSLNLGQMDLCTYDIPPQIMTLVSIGMVFIIVPLGIHLVKRMLSLYKEITG